jgi:oligosaccharide repeat unit polymerase
MDIKFGVLLMVLNLWLFLWMCRKELTGSSVLLTPVAIFGLMEIISVWPAPFYAYLNNIVQDGYAAVVAGLSFLMFLAGAMVARYLWCIRPGEPRRFLERPILDNYGTRGWWGAAIGLVALLIAVGLLLYQGMPPQIRLFAEALRHGQPLSIALPDIAEFRYNLTKSYLFGGEYRGQGVMRVFLSMGWLYVMCLAMVHAVAAKNSSEFRLWKIRFILMALFSLLFIAGEGTRAPFLMVLVQLVAAFSLLRPIKRTAMLNAALAGFVLIIALSMVSYKSMSWMNAKHPLLEGAQAVLQRISTGNGINNVYIIEHIRDGMFNFMEGNVHLRSLLATLPGTRFSEQSFSNILAETMRGRFTTSHSTSTYLGTLYFDFGLLGCMLGYGLIGFVLQWAQHFFFQRPKRVVALPLMLLLSTSLGLISLYGWIALLPKLAVLVFCDVLVRSLRRLRWAPYGPIKAEPPVVVPAPVMIRGREKP